MKGYNADTACLKNHQINSHWVQKIFIDTINHRDNGIHSYNVCLNEYMDGLNKYFKSLKICFRQRT